MYTRLFNGCMDKLIRPNVYLCRRSWSAFHLCGCAGLGSAIVLAMILTTQLGLSAWFMGGITVAALLSFFALAIVTKIITGEERLTYYHHVIAVLAVVSGLLRLLRQPILPYLDPTLLGVGLFVAYGRVGCLMVGCCHGRPHRLGVCYRQEHADAGFMTNLVGVRLFPIQAVESVWVFGIVLTGSVLVLRGRPPGSALTWYLVAYGLGRFCFEFMRGDPDRPHLWGFTEAQWASLLLPCAVVWAESAGILPCDPWHTVAAASMAFAMIIVTAAGLCGSGWAFGTESGTHGSTIRGGMDA